jgi:hypothetical protein
MAFTAGSPAHPAYGAGHATVAGACVTILKAYFRLLDENDNFRPLSIATLNNFPTYLTGIDASGVGTRVEISAGDMTIEGELNKLASNVAMGRSMGGVHWRTDNTRSLILGEAMAAHVLAGLSTGLIEHPTFVFRTFGQICDDGNGQPRLITIRPKPPQHPDDPVTESELLIDGQAYKLTNGTGPGSSLSDLLNPPDAFKAP